MTRNNPLLLIMSGLDTLDAKNHNEKTINEMQELGWTTTAPPEAQQIGVPVPFKMIGNTKLYATNVVKGEN